MFNFTWETILSLIPDLLFDLSIIQAYPTIFAFFSFTNFEHSKLDLPVVITSSIIRTLDFLFIMKPFSLPDVVYKEKLTQIAKEKKEKKKTKKYLDS